MPAPTRRHVLVTGAKSRSHLVYIASYLRHVLDDADLTALRISFVEAPAFLTAPAVTADNLRAALPDDPRLTIERGMSGWRFAGDHDAEYVSVGAPGLRATLHLRRANPARRVRVVVTDEGIGSYGSWENRRDAMVRQGARRSVATAKSLVITGASRALTTSRWAAYLHTDGGWVPNPDVASEFTRVLDSDTGTTDTAVVLTQPFVDLGLVPERTYLDYVDVLCDAARSVGLEAWVRPHPAENPGRYAGRRVLAARGPAEFDPAVRAAAVVLGGPSTGLVNLSAMLHRPVVWVSAPGLEYLDTEVSRAQTEIFATFLGGPVQPSRAADAVRARVTESFPRS